MFQNNERTEWIVPMPRPKKCRRVHFSPNVTFYKPSGIPMCTLKVARLPVEGLEALRLSDSLGLDQARAAEAMGVSKPTFCRILSAARKTVADALTKGMAIHIEGGNYAIKKEEERT